jgi:8-oxo-dGTP pyrophosphatase MutT (NUDIX family)
LSENPQSAGIIIVDVAGDEPLFLALQTDTGFDIPKGRVDKVDGGDHFSAAKREVEEEVSLSSLDFLWGMNYFDTSKTRCWIAQTDQSPKIRPNPETGEKEHKGFQWVGYSEMKNNCHGHLQGAINWAYELTSGEK